MLALMITASFSSFMFIVNCLRNLLSKGIPLKLTDFFVILTEKTFAGIFLDRIGLIRWAPVLWTNWKAKFLSIVKSHAPIKTKRVRYLGSHQTCGRVCAIAMWLNGKPLSLTILKTATFTKGYVIRSMERLNLPRHPIMLMHFSV